MRSAARSSLPLRYRLRAWWDGIDARALALQAAEARAGSPAAEPVSLSLAPRPFETLPTRPRELAPEAPRATGWVPVRLAAAQLVWGEGHLAPAGEMQLRGLAADMNIAHGSSVLHLGAELGGVAEIMRRGTGCRVLPADTHTEFAEASGNRVTLLTDTSEALASEVDLLLVDHLADRGEPLARILRTQGRSLVRGGHLVIRALTSQLGSSSRKRERMKDWTDREPLRPRLRSAEELKRIVQEAGLVLERMEERSDAYVQEVEAAWRAAVDAVRLLPATEEGRALSDMLLMEGERWSARMALFESGVLSYREIVARRRDGS